MVEIAGQKATLGGRELLGSAPVRWRLVEGVEPAIETFEVPIAEVAQYEDVADLHTPQTLIMQRTEVIGRNNQAKPGERLKIENVRVITAEPGPNPHIGRIQVGDIRWMFPYLRIWKQYNVRARKSVNKLQAFGDPNLAQDVSRDQYLAWSLNPITGQPWTALEIIKDVLENTTDGLARDLLLGELVNIQVDNDVDDLKSVSLEDIQIDGAGDDALRQALSLLPGVGLFVNVDGKIQLYNKFNAQREGDQIGRLGPPIVGAGIIEQISNSTTRPREVHCLFPRKVEVRFDFEGSRIGPLFAVRDLSTRGLQNVIQVVDPDFDVFLPFGAGAQGKAAQGEWLEASTYIASLAGQAAKIGSKRLKKFSQKLLEQAQIPWVGLWSLIEAAGLDDLATAGGDVSKFQWASRFGSLRTHYLQTFRLNKEWTRRARLIEARLVGVFDVENATRAESPVWADHCVVPGLKSLLVGGHKGVKFCLATNQYHFPGSKEDPKTLLPVPGDAQTPYPADTRPSPFRVDILDDQQGLLRITPRGDIYGNWDTLIPCPVLNRPCYNPENGVLDGLSFDSQLQFQEDDKIPRLDTPSARMSIIITMVPATPNGIDQFHRIVVKPADAIAVLPQGARRGLGNAKGPIKELMIKDEVARVFWRDASAEIIHRMFGLPPGEDVDLGVADPAQVVTRAEAAPITLNDNQAAVVPIFDVGRGADLEDIAVARAAQVYASEQDRPVGQQTGPLRPQIRPAGFLSEVTHVLEPDGTMLTHLQLPEAVPGIELEAFLDQNTRKVINKELGAE